MIGLQQKKRNTAFLLFITFFLIIPFISSIVLHNLTEVNPYIPAYTSCISIVLGFIFWFKAHYHWSKAKGYSGWMTFLAITGIPISPIIFACLKDNRPEPPSLTDPVRKCPHCNAEYKAGDYDPAAPQIFCSWCKGEIPRE